MSGGAAHVVEYFLSVSSNFQLRGLFDDAVIRNALAEGVAFLGGTPVGLEDLVPQEAV